MDTHTPMKAGLRKLMIAFGVGLLVAVGAALGVGLASDLKRTECNHPTVVTYEEALAAGRRLNCTFLHDDPNYAQQLSATFAANDLGDGPTTEYSQREYDSHIAVIAPAQRALLDECLGESAGGRSERRRLDSCPQGVCPPVFAASISTWPGHLSNGKNVYVDAGVTHTFSLPENPDTCWASSCPQPCAGCIRKDGYCSTLYRDGIRLRRFPSNDAERCYDNGGTWANGVTAAGGTRSINTNPLLIMVMMLPCARSNLPAAQGRSGQDHTHRRVLWLRHGTYIAEELVTQFFIYPTALGAGASNDARAAVRNNVIGGVSG